MHETRTELEEVPPAEDPEQPDGEQERIALTPVPMRATRTPKPPAPQAQSTGMLSKAGQFQTGVKNLEIHIKDEARFPGKWAFFVSDGKSAAEYMPPAAACYACHSQHGAVETTFVQFYPTMLTIAKARGTLEAAYIKESETLAKGR